MILISFIIGAAMLGAGLDLLFSKWER